jgi:hypothetical protein
MLGRAMAANLRNAEELHKAATPLDEESHGETDRRPIDEQLARI